MKKLYAVLEQGCEPNYPLATKHKDQFNTEYSDCFRLNWKADANDTWADFYKGGIVWSEGRSHLFEQVIDKYEYYIFIDDDMDFVSETYRTVSEEIKYLLEKYKPIHGSINNTMWPTLPNISSEVMRMRDGDLCVQIFRNDYAKIMFPTWFHGSGKSMWYAQFAVYMCYPEKSVFINSVKAKNTRHEQHFNYGKKTYHNEDRVFSLFTNLLHTSHKKIFATWGKSPLLDMTEECYKKYISTEDISVDMQSISDLFVDPSMVFERFISEDVRMR